MTLIREVRIEADKENSGQSRTEFYLHGQLGTIQFVFWTDLRGGYTYDGPRRNTFPVDVGYHWDRKQYKGQSKMTSCHVREQGYCFYDGSGLTADKWLAILREQGSDAIWPLMEDYYESMKPKNDEAQ